MKKIILLLGLQIALTVVNAQYSLQPMLPTKGMIQKSSLWNILIINNSQNSIAGRLELILRDRTSGLEQITATTNQITIEKGARQLNNTLLAPIQYNFLNEGFIKQNQDLIPIGNYTACYRFTNPNGQNITLVEECVQFDVEPLSPPMLVTPNDNAELAIQPTQFSWSPPTPIGLFNQLKYDVVIVEVLPEQKPEEAIQQNLPIYTENNTPNNFINYKGSKLNFQKDKLYAWQVIAKDNSEYAAKSEVWSFKVVAKETNTAKVINSSPYVILQDIVTQYAVAPNGILKLFYNNKNSSDRLNITLEEQNSNSTSVSNSIVVPLIIGENLINLKLNKYIKCKRDASYKAIITTSNFNYTVFFNIKEIK